MIERDLADKVGQRWIALEQPSSRRHTIGFVLELLGPELIEVFEAVTDETMMQEHDSPSVHHGSTTAGHRGT